MAVENAAYTGVSSEDRQLLNVQDAAKRLGVSASFLNKARLSGGGPLFLKLGTRVAYDPADLTAWIGERRRASTTGTPS